VLARGLPGFLREGFLPLAAFYAGWRLSGTVVGIAAATGASLALYAYERRAGRDGLLVRLALAFVVVQAAAGLVTGSATVYLAAPVVANAVWAAAFLARAGLRLAALHHGVGSFVFVTFLTGTPAMLALLAWSIWFAIRKLADELPPPASQSIGFAIETQAIVPPSERATSTSSSGSNPWAR
jgi:hypothetical protein